jgi:hypothetical protein
VNLTGTMKIAGQARVYKLKRAARLVAVNQRPTVTLGLWSPGVRALRAALKKGRRVTASVRATALDAAKNPATASQNLQAIR